MRCIRRLMIIIITVCIIFVLLTIHYIVPFFVLQSPSDTTRLWPIDHQSIVNRLTFLSPITTENNDLPILGNKNEKLRLDYSNARSIKNSKMDKKIILMWAGPEDVDEENLNGCLDYGCTITHDRRLSSRSSAIVFMHGGTAGEVPSVRYPWQYYVFFTQESPSHIFVAQPYRDFFNLTLTYRRDSDAPSPYGYAVKRPKPVMDWMDKNFSGILKGKSKLVAWFVSNCDAPSRRDQYVNELKKYIPVDIYGSCGSLTCSRRPSFSIDRSSRNDQIKKIWTYDNRLSDEELDYENDKDDCDRMLERDYKFYLAFENSICQDYVTEKFWQKLTLKIILIVLKRSIIENFAPPDSFIAADDFRSPRELAKYLYELANDRSAYQNRFEWRKNYRPIFLNGRRHDIRERPWGFCTLCSIITNRSKIYRRSYSDVNDWWVNNEKCDNDLVKRLLSNATHK